MLCENCGKNYANVKYTQIINGHKKEITLCEECSKQLGIGNINFNMPIDFSSFFGDFVDEFENSLIPSFHKTNQLKCKNCNLSFDEFMKTGKFGCSKCVEAFQDKLDPILKQIQGANRHIGRLGKIKLANTEDNIDNYIDSNIVKNQNKSLNSEKSVKEVSKIQRLKQELKDAIGKENYELAAQIRDKIKEIEKK